MFSFEVVHVHERQLSHARNGNELLKNLQCWLLLDEIQLAGKNG